MYRLVHGVPNMEKPTGLRVHHPVQAIMKAKTGHDHRQGAVQAARCGSISGASGANKVGQCVCH
jgi:hypothetical protein